MRRPTTTLLAFLLALPLVALALPLVALAQDDVRREEAGTRVTENIPPIPPDLVQRLQRYSNTRSAAFAGWTADGGVLVSTRFGDTTQVHRVAQPGGAREQLTFYDEPVTSVAANPRRDGFVFGRDAGGSEFWQLYWFDLATRDTKLLTDGTSRNASPVWSHDGASLAYSSTARNGKDTDVWVLDLASGDAKPVVAEGGHWEATDFSPDGKRLLVQQVVSINEMHPGVVDLASGKLTRFPVEGTAAFGAFRFAPDGSGAWFTSDEGSEFLRLRFHDFASDRIVTVGEDIPWDVEEFALSRDGRRIAFVSNEDGYGVLHLLDAKTRKALPLPANMPLGIVRGLEFSPDGRHLGFTFGSATATGDAYAITLGEGDAEPTLARWTTSEVGGLDPATFVAPELVHFPTFDRVDGQVRRIPAFWYRPVRPAGGRAPVVIMIHGGPESQARPGFSADIQYLAGQLGISVLVPNVRGSAGYGKGYLKLDNGMKREDSVRDIGALLDWIATRPELDASRVAVYGGSYGGYMVLAAMTHYNDRLRAGIDIVGISNFVTFLTNTQGYRRDLRRAEYGDERDPAMLAHLEKISPTTNARAITIPLFVAQGANDPRVPASEAEQIVRTVRGNGGEVWFLQFGDEGHGFRKKPNVDYFRAATMLFWQRHLLGGEAGPA